MTRSPTTWPVGVQEPRIRVLAATSDPSYDRLGLAALRLAERVGSDQIDLMPWQEGAVLDFCAVNGNEWAASTCAEVVSRQNGKGGVLEVRVLAGLLLFRERRILWTAHRGRTAKDAHKRMVQIFLSHPDLKARLKGGSEKDGVTWGNDSRAIILENGATVEFFTRSSGAGRGLPADLLILDEAFDLTDDELNGLRFTLRTAAMRTGRRSQTIYASTPPDEEVHRNGEVFARLRKRALAGAPGITWLEWSVPTLAELTAMAEAEGRRLLGDPRLPDPERDLPADAVALWAQGNPSLGYLFDLQQLLSDRNESGDRGMLVEGLAAPDFWPDPDASDAGEPAIDFEAWKRRRDPDARRGGPMAPQDPVVLGLEVSPRGTAWLSLAAWRPDGRMHGEQVWSGPSTAAVAVLLQVVGKVDPAALVLDGRGKASSLLPDIRAAKLDPLALTAAERSQADEGLARDVATDALRLPARPMPDMDAAAESVTWRVSKTSELRFFDGRPAALVSLSLARHGLLTVAATQKPKPPTSPPSGIRTEAVAVAGIQRIGDLASVSF